jgi:ATP-dependent exoDNAse (exonuclease V) beta subunit
MRREYASRPRPLAELLEELEELRATPSEAEAPPPEAGNTVSLMSIHAAKGLEFPVVFVSALSRGPDRRKPVIACSAEAGLGVKWRNPATGKGQSDSAHALLMEGLKLKEEAEENRLLYVAATRAKDRLILSYAERNRASSWQKRAETAIGEATVAEQAPEIPPLVQAAAETMIEELLPRPVLTGQYDSSAAVTDVTQFRACPRKYYLSRYLGFVSHPEPFAREREDQPQELRVGGVRLGSDVHAILAGAGNDVTAGEARELAGRFAASELGQRTRRAARIEREFDFLLDVEGVVLRGQIDLWFEEAGELIVVDYKTDRDLYYLRSNHAVDVTLSQSELDAARADVEAMRTAQESVGFPTREGKQCGRCGYRGGLCPVT